jgi:hypothetical protein
MWLNMHMRRNARVSVCAKVQSEFARIDGQIVLVHVYMACICTRDHAYMLVYIIMCPQRMMHAEVNLFMHIL